MSPPTTGRKISQPRNQHCFACHLFSCCLLACSRPWRWMQYVPPKRRSTFQRTIRRYIQEDRTTQEYYSFRENYLDVAPCSLVDIYSNLHSHRHGYLESYMKYMAQTDSLLGSSLFPWSTTVSTGLWEGYGQRRFMHLLVRCIQTCCYFCTVVYIAYV
jgi:hypothetical protein